MESDSSLENEETQQNRRDWSKVPPAQNSDVSDDENFSRGAKSIESPPESPWGGANLDSPPASPAPRRSPGSVSGSERARSPERPQTPDSGPESPQNSSSPQNSRNSAPSSPNSQSSKNGSRSRKSRSSSSEGRSRSPSSENERNSPKRATQSPHSDKGPQSPVSDKPNSPNNKPRSPSSTKEGPQSPASENGHSPPKKSPTRPNYRKQQNDSSDSDTSPLRNSFHSDSDEDDRSSEDYRRRRKSNKRSSSVSSTESGRRNTTKPQQDKDLDLSDVSDCDSLGPVSDDDNKNIDKEKNEKEDGEKTDLTMIDDSEQLDFEAEETENKVENGEIIPQKPPQQKPPPPIEKIQELKDEGELEEGELSDEGEARPEETEPRPVCRFFSRGQCTWGSSCSYRHVGEGGGPPPAQNQKVAASATPVAVKPPVQHPPVQHSAPMMQHGPPLMHHGAPMHHPPRFVPRPHGPPFFRRPLRPMFPRFVHPGVTDKGNYTMFEMVRPLVPMNAGAPMLHGGPHGPPHHPPHHHMYPPHMDPYMRPPHIERPPPPMVRTQMPPPYQHQQAVQRKEPDSSSESAWERGLRQAKELIRKSSKRKETDADFEEKKMTMSVSGGAEGVDKEGEFYSQAPHSAAAGTTSPYEEEHYSRYNKVDERRLSREGYRERGYEYGAGGGGAGWGGYDEEGSPPPPPVHHRAPHRYPPPRHHHPGAREHQRGVDYDYYDEREDRERDRERERRRDGKERSRRKSRSYRDKQSPRETGGHIDKQPPPPYDLSPSEVAEKRRYERGRGGTKGSKRGADDEWADPWMRSKSPARKSRPVRKPSYSSKSSFSSSSSSRSSSYSSYSRSESRSSGTGSSRSRSRSTSAKRRIKKRKTSTSRRNKSPFSRGSDKRSSDVERSLHMNPPAPSPTAANVYSRLSPSQRRDRKEINARLLVAAIRKNKRSSSKSSSSGSDSSNSSDDSSSSMSESHSSSSSRSPSPAPLPSASHKSSRKKVVLDEKLAQTMKVKAMDALKLSGQKQQIKLNLKGKESLSERLQQMPISSSRKRAAETLPFDDGSPSNAKMSKKSGPSRREELLKQLKAVEDAIARKRSKI